MLIAFRSCPLKMHSCLMRQKPHREPYIGCSGNHTNQAACARKSPEHHIPIHRLRPVAAAPGKSFGADASHDARPMLSCRRWQCRRQRSGCAPPRTAPPSCSTCPPTAPSPRTWTSGRWAASCEPPTHAMRPADVLLTASPVSIHRMPACCVGRHPARSRLACLRPFEAVMGMTLGRLGE